MPYDTLRDFVNLALLGGGPNVLIARPRVRLKTLADFVDAAKAKPGQAELRLRRRRQRHAFQPREAQDRDRHRRAARAVQGHARGDRRHHRRTACAATGRRSTPRCRTSTAARRWRSPCRARSARRCCRTCRASPSRATPASTTRSGSGCGARRRCRADIAAKINKDVNAALASPDLRERLTKLGTVPGNMTIAQFTDFVRKEIDDTQEDPEGRGHQAAIRRRMRFFLAAAAAASRPTRIAQTYPNKPVQRDHLVHAGSSTDIVGRVVDGEGRRSTGASRWWPRTAPAPAARSARRWCEGGARRLHAADQLQRAFGQPGDLRQAALRHDEGLHRHRAAVDAAERAGGERRLAVQDPDGPREPRRRRSRARSTSAMPASAAAPTSTPRSFIAAAGDQGDAGAVQGHARSGRGDVQRNRSTATGRRSPPACRTSRAASCARWRSAAAKRNPTLPEVPTTGEAGVKGADCAAVVRRLGPRRHARRHRRARSTPTCAGRSPTRA